MKIDWRKQKILSGMNRQKKTDLFDLEAFFSEEMSFSGLKDNDGYLFTAVRSEEESDDFWEEEEEIIEEKPVLRLPDHLGMNIKFSFSWKSDDGLKEEESLEISRKPALAEPNRLINDGQVIKIYKKAVKRRQ